MRDCEQMVDDFEQMWSGSDEMMNLYVQNASDIVQVVSDSDEMMIHFVQSANGCDHEVLADR